MEINLIEFCAPGTKFKEELIPVTEDVSLKLITFTPFKTNNNPAVVFVPGWISMINGWKEVLQEITKDFTVYYLETREKISSQIIRKVDYSVEEIGKDLIRFINILRLQDRKYILLGSSLGATSILDCSKDLHINPLCLVLINPNAEFRMPKWGVFIIRLFYPPLYNFIKPYIKWYFKTFRLDVKHDYEQYEKYCNVLDFADPWKLKHAALSVYKYSVWNLLDKIKYPTLILGASKDKLHEPLNLKRIVSLMKKVEYVEMETNKSTHSKEVVKEIRKYLTDLS